MPIWNRLFSRRRRYDDLSASIQEHLDEKIDELVDSGMPRREAEQAARRAFGNVTLLQERSREAWQWPLLESIWADVRYAFRQMRKNPGFAAVTIGTLALGIGAATALFTVVDHVLLRPVPYRDADRLVEIMKSTHGNPDGGLSPALADIRQWMRQSRSFESMAYWTEIGGVNFLVDRASSLQIRAEHVSSNLFATLGVQPEMGRTFTSAETAAPSTADANTVVLSDALWKALNGGDKAILGQSVSLNGKSYTVIGVMPGGFTFPANSTTSPEAWFPIEPSPAAAPNSLSSGDFYTVLARLRPGIGVASARSEMNLIQARIAEQYKDSYDRKDQTGVVLKTYVETLVTGNLRKALLALFAASLVLWLIAVVNVTNLLLARGTARQREIAMRGALGATRGRVLRQMLIEGLILSGTASLLGLGLSVASVKLVAHQLEKQLPLGVPPSIPDSGVLSVLLAMTIVTAVLATLWPAWMAARVPIEPALRHGGLQAGTGRSHHRFRSILVSIEIAMSLSLLVSCGLLLRTIYAMRQVPLGFRVNHILVTHLAIPSYRYSGRDVGQALYEPLLKRVQQIKGVDAAGFMSEVPLGHGFRIQVSLYHGSKPIDAFLKLASPQMQQIFAMHMLAGRYFSSQDTPNSDAAVVVNHAFARAYAPDKHDPASVLGMPLWDLTKGHPLRIVGVLDDEHQAAITKPSIPEVELCTCQITPEVGMYGSVTFVMTLAIRTDLPQSAIVPQLRAILRQIAPELEHADITTMDQVVADSYGSQRLAAHLLEGFGAAALLLCVAGIYGLLSYIVAQRTHELGVRVALGADRADLLWLVMRQAAAMLLAGAALGTGLAFASARLIRGFLYGVKAHDTLTLATAAIFLVACGLVAASIPARRAASVNPMEALRAE
ncbi:MAG: ADOP family duplicated permease [Acidobacteriota bacterium]